MAKYDKDSVNLALLAHDLRTPLGAMRLTAELIGNGPLNDSQKDQLATLLRAIDSLDQMTTGLIADATPDHEPEETAVSIASVVSDCTSLFQVAAHNKGLSLKVRLQETAGHARSVQGGQLRRVLSALLDNAIKYTDAGRVTVEVISCPQPAGADTHPKKDQALDEAPFWVSIAVTDTGPGIDPKERDNLFRPFVRGEQASEKVPGSGLGLWGTAQTVLQLGGYLYQSRPEAGGCRFDVQIPVESPPALGNGDVAESEEDGATAAEAADALPGNVLIVDDNDTNCRLLAALLECFGVSSGIANSGEEAIGLVQKTDYDAVLLDLNMPGMSGIETAQELRAIRPAQELPLIAVTAALESFGDKRLRKAGFQEVLAKPLSPSALHEALVRARRTKNVFWV